MGFFVCPMISGPRRCDFLKPCYRKPSSRNISVTSPGQEMVQFIYFMKAFKLPVGLNRATLAGPSSIPFEKLMWRCHQYFLLLECGWKRLKAQIMWMEMCFSSNELLHLFPFLYRPYFFINSSLSNSPTPSAPGVLCLSVQNTQFIASKVKSRPASW